MAATKRRKKKGQLSLQLALNDERIPKMAGFLLLFLAIYLFIAFVSYLFTWHIDQDRVLRFSWSLFLQGDQEMANWLGRLGAILSNMFFYWSFGLPSFLIVGMLTLVGITRIKKEPLAKYYSHLRLGLFLMVVLSIFLEFIMPNADFPFGGAFGEAISTWLSNFVGTIGMVVLFVFLILGIGIWTLNPNFNEMTTQSLLTDVKSFFYDLFRGRLPAKKAIAPATKAAVAAELAPPTLRPSRDGDATLNAGVVEGTAATDVTNQTPLPAVEAGEQLAFEMPKDKKREKPKSLNPGEASLEIEVQKPAPPRDPMAEEPEMVIQKNNLEHTDPYDPTLDLSSYEHPVVQLLYEYEDNNQEIDRSELERNKDQIIETLLNYKIEITKIKATVGPTVTLYEIVPAPGVRISKIKNLEDDIALSLAALGIRIIAPIPGKGTIGIEVPNQVPQTVGLKEILMSDKFKRAKMDLPIALGKTIANEVFVADLAKMPHLLVAGATGQGKSVGINAILTSLLYKKHPSQLKLVLIDPKKVELFPYHALNHHFLASLPGLDEPIVTDTTKVVHTLNSLSIEVDARYNLLKKGKARNIKEYNEKFVSRKLNPENGHRFLPFIVLVIDEFADLIMTAGKEIELPIGRLAQLSRAVGIHLIIATQRPSVNIITGVIKANFPARIAYKVTAKVDSRTILDTGGADQLIGRGDMLLSFGSDLIRLQCAFIDTPEVEKVINFISEQRGYPTPFHLPEFHGDDEEIKGTGLKHSDVDANFDEAARLVVQNQHGSTSMIQRRLKLGYNRAGRIMDQLEAMGIVGPSNGAKAREVLIYDPMDLERYLEDMKTRK